MSLYFLVYFQSICLLNFQISFYIELEFIAIFKSNFIYYNKLLSNLKLLNKQTKKCQINIEKDYFNQQVYLIENLKVNMQRN